MKKISALKILKPYIKNESSDIVTSIIAIISIAISFLFFINEIKILIDSNEESKTIYTLLKLLLIIIFFSVASFIRSYKVNLISERIILQIRNQALNQILKMKIQNFEELKSSEILDIFNSSPVHLKNIIVECFSYLSRNILLLTSSIIMMLIINIKLTLIMSLGIIISTIPFFYLFKSLKNISSNSILKFSKILESIDINIKAIKLIYGSNLQEREFNKFKKLNDDYFLSSKKKILIISLFFTLTILLMLLIVISIILIGTIFSKNLSISKGELTAYILYLFNSAFAVIGISEILSSFPKYLESISRIIQLIQNHNLEDRNDKFFKINITKNQDLENIHTVKINNLCFSYPSSPNNFIFKNFNADFSKGFNLIKGQTGSGKTSLAQLLVRYYEPESGKITINNTNIHDIRINKLRNIIKYISQEPIIFSGTIIDNIKFINPNASKEEFDKIVKICKLEDLIQSKKQIIYHDNSNNGIKLSAGQKQRIALARTLLSAPDIIILDEATNCIDSELESCIFNDLRELLKDKICIIIAHRSEVISKVSKIIKVS